MADLDPAPHPSDAPAPLSSPSKEDPRPMGERIAELDESQSELMGRLHGLKEELQNWRTKLDSQVKTYKDELLELKKVLNTDLELLTSEFKELRTTLQKQQEDVSASLKDLGLEDHAAEAAAAEHGRGFGGDAEVPPPQEEVGVEESLSNMSSSI